jgi:putative ABC transport system permease protein
MSIKDKTSWWAFAVAGIGALMVTVVTVSCQTICAATAKLAESLKSE